jgi:hypothetical protein
MESSQADLPKGADGLRDPVSRLDAYPVLAAIMADVPYVSCEQICSYSNQICSDPNHCMMSPAAVHQPAASLV